MRVKLRLFRFAALIALLFAANGLYAQNTKNVSSETGETILTEKQAAQAQELHQKQMLGIIRSDEPKQTVQRRNPNPTSFVGTRAPFFVNTNKGLRSAKNINVCILTPDVNAAAATLQTALQQFTDLTVDVLAEDLSTLQLSDLTPYHVVVMYNDLRWSSANTTAAAVGDILADYIDGGGKVVENMYTQSFDEWGFDGRYMTDGYSPLTTATADNWNPTELGTVHMASHPVMLGITAVGQTSGVQNPGIATGADRIADWDDGSVMVAANENVVAINIMPIDPQPAGTWTGDMMVLYHNAIVWLGNPTDDAAPGAATDFTATPGASGTLSADLSWTNPAQTYAQETLTDLDSVLVFRGDEKVYEDEAPTIAATDQTYTDNGVTTAGWYTYSVVGFNDAGPGEAAAQTIFVGYDVGVVSIDMMNFYETGADVTPKATVENVGDVAQSFDVTLTIDDGTKAQVYSQTVSVTDLAGETQEQVTFPDWTAVDGDFTVSVSVALTDDGNDANDELSGHTFNASDVTTAYAFVGNGGGETIPQGPATTFLENPSVITSIAAATPSVFGSTYLMNSWIGIHYETNSLVAIDPTDGTIYPVAELTPIEDDHIFTSVAWDNTTQNLYMVSTDLANPATSTLYFFNGEDAEVVGSDANNHAVFSIAVHPTSGDMFAFDVISDRIYSVDKGTGALTVLSETDSLGFSANYIQDLEFTEDGSTLYFAAYNADTESGEMRIVDTSNGTSTLVGAFPEAVDVTGLAVPVEPALANDVGIVSITAPNSGPNMGMVDVTAVFHNFGSADQTDVPVAYKIGESGTPVTGTIASLPAGGYVEYTFTTQADFSATETYELYVYSELTGDEASDNDMQVKEVTNYGPLYAMGGDTLVTACQGLFTDSGQLEDPYANDEVSKVTFMPGTPGALVEVIFLEFNVESQSTCNYDGLMVYNGDVADEANLIGTYCGTDIPEEFLSTHETGALTFVFYSDGSVPADGWVAEISCFEPLEHDIDLTEIVSPIDDFCGNDGTVKLKFQNVGTEDITSVDFTYQVNDETPVTETADFSADPVEQWGVWTYEFTQGFSLATATVHNVTVSAELTGDTNTEENELSKEFENHISIPLAGELEDFEDMTQDDLEGEGVWLVTGESAISVESIDGNGLLLFTGGTSEGWTNSEDANPWEINPTHSAKLNICVDATSESAMHLNFDLKQEYSYNDYYSNFRISVNGEQISETLRPVTSNEDPFESYALNLSSYAGSNFLLTIESRNKYNNAEGNEGQGDNALFDNVEFAVPPACDLRVLEVLSPTPPEGSCQLGDAENVTVVVENFGAEAQADFALNYELNGDAAVTETITESLAPGDTMHYTFTNAIDLSAVGEYNFKVYSTPPTGETDGDNDNDTIMYSVISTDAIITIDLTPDFFASEISWELVNAQEEVVAAGEGPDTYPVEICVLSTECYSFNLFDSYGDGGADVEVFYNGESAGTIASDDYTEKISISGIGDGCPVYEYTVNVTTNTSADAVGAVVTLTNDDADPNHVYTENAPVGGATVFDRVWEGDYTLEVELDGYDTYSGSVSITADGSTDVELQESLTPPYDLSVDVSAADGSAVFAWNEGGGGSGGAALTEGFETSVPPADWTHQQTNTTASWHQAETIEFDDGDVAPHEGSYQAATGWDYSAQDEWLITPSFTPDGTSELSFWTYTGAYGSDHLDHYYVKVSTDGSTWTELWDAVTATDPNPGAYAEITLDLSSYAGQNIQLAWQAVDGDGQGLWFWWIIDEIVVTAEGKAITFDGKLKTRSLARKGNTTIASTPFSRDGSAKAKSTKAIESFNVYLDDLTTPVATGVTEVEHTFTDLIHGQSYTAGVSATYTTGTSEISTIDFTGNNTTAISDLVEGDIMIFPNPTKGILNIQNVENANIYVFNILGEMVTSVTNSSLNTTIDMSQFGTGNYIVKIQKDDKVITHKVSVTR